MKQLDKNNDGSVSMEEAKKDRTISQRFKELDKDNDGKLSATELSAAGATGAGGPGKDRSSPGSTGSTSPGRGSPKKSY
jgi:Ca2+-binding EF-hand superfamily protein